MGYEIYVEIDKYDDCNLEGDFDDIDSDIACLYPYKYFIKGDHHRKAELTKKISDAMIDAGFYSFNIYHSY